MSKKTMASPLLIILCLLLTTCTRKAEEPYRVEVKEGIEHVHNSAEPLYPDKSVHFGEELSIFPEDKDGQILIYRSGSYAVDESGHMYICDLQDQNIKVFDPSGQYVRSIGGKGEGPERCETGAQGQLPGRPSAPPCRGTSPCGVTTERSVVPFSPFHFLGRAAGEFP